MKVIRTANRLVAIALLCASVTWAQNPSDHSVTSSKYEPQQKVLIISDNQEHLLTGVPLSANSSLSDTIFTSVARRSPLANVGGRLLFREALKFGISEGAGLVLHLGDASDISCPDELSAAFNAMEAEAKNIWFMAPGNHDGIQVGNYVKDQPTSLGYKISRNPVFYTNTPPVEKFKDAEETWLNACLSPTNFKDARRADILTKEDVIQRYVALLKARPGAGEPEKLEPLRVPIKGVKVRVTCEVEKFKIKAQAYTYTAIASICPRTPVTTPPTPDTPWVGPYASFMVQRLDVGKTRIIMLDTSDYENPQVRNVAFTGDLSEAQKKLADSLLEEDKFDRKNVIVIGHHPLKVFPRDQQEWIIERTGRYISGHTHSSASKINHSANGDKTVELNVGSTVDYPPQAIIANIGPGTMSFRVTGANTGRAGFLAPCKDEKNREKWMLSPTTLYTEYKRELYVKHLLDALKAAAVRIAPSDPALKIPAGDKPADWPLLEDALKTINAAEGDARIFWACQAYYAAEATKDEKSWWERVPKFGFGFQRGVDATTDPDGWQSLTSP